LTHTPHDTTRRHLLLGAFAAAVASPALSRSASAQAYPERLIRIVAPFPPGGPVDAGARILATAMAQATKQTVIVENRPGAAGSVGLEAVTRAPPDGYTLCFASTGAVAVNQSLNPATSPDSRKDLAPITVTSAVPLLIASRASLPATDLQGLLALAKRGPITYGTSGPGSTPHLAGELLKQRAGVDMTHVPYRGAAPAVTGLLTGEIDIAFLDPLVLLPHVREGTKMRALAVTSPVRSDAMPDIPTVAECGVSGVEVENWYALLAPAATPRDRIERLWQISRDTLRRPDVARQFTDQGGRMVVTSPEESAAFIATEIDKWAKLVRSANIRAE